MNDYELLVERFSFPAATERIEIIQLGTYPERELHDSTFNGIRTKLELSQTSALAIRVLMK